MRSCCAADAGPGREPRAVIVATRRSFAAAPFEGDGSDLHSLSLRPRGFATRRLAHMLDSLVRVSRRVGGTFGRSAPDPERRAAAEPRERPEGSEHWRQSFVPCEPDRGPGRALGRPRRSSVDRAGRQRRAITRGEPREGIAPSPSRRASGCSSTGRRSDPPGSAPSACASG